ncbi:MAG: hypothetical protein DWC02_00710 [Candidatus Poseidoniales archaeon]|nr:MAG: hypothetical protein DWC02_00710 [Candidatus Poseidoniales archaeon]
MDIKELDLNGGTFKVNLPYNWVGWLLWAIGLAITLAGLFVAMNDINGLGVAAFGLLFMALTSPGSLEAKLHQVRQSAIDPAELEAKAEASGLSIDNWWMKQTSYVPTTDPSDWILPAPGPSTWNNDDRYGPEGDGSALPEHPSKIGTPIPATMTLFSVYCLLAISLILVFTASIQEDYTPAIIITLIGLILSLVGFFRAKMVRQMIDTPTSLVRSAPVGNPELVGQVRPIDEGCLTVVVDGNQNMTVGNMVGYQWSYEQYQCRTTTDSEGNSKEECHWVTIRSDAGGCPFILHDGTGGIRVNTISFKRIDYGQYLKRWDGAFAQTLGKQIMASAIAGMLGGARVKKHRWTLYGLRLGNPVYVLGQTKPRPSEALQAEGLDGTLGNSIIEVWGNEDAPGVKCTLNRGSELSNLGRSRSGFELVILPIIMMIGGISLFGLA